MIIWAVPAVAVLGLGYIRLAPADPARWHVAPQITGSRDSRSGVLRVVETGADGLARLDAVARATPRTRVLAGAVAEGMITYVTRSKLFGFPDYTTVLRDGDNLKIQARQRFGRSDFGVNRARVDGWIDALQP